MKNGILSKRLYQNTLDSDEHFFQKVIEVNTKKIRDLSMYQLWTYRERNQESNPISNNLKNSRNKPGLKAEGPVQWKRWALRDTERDNRRCSRIEEFISFERSVPKGQSTDSVQSSSKFYWNSAHKYKNNRTNHTEAQQILNSQRNLE